MLNALKWTNIEKKKSWNPASICPTKQRQHNVANCKSSHCNYTSPHDHISVPIRLLDSCVSPVGPQHLTDMLVSTHFSSRQLNVQFGAAKAWDLCLLCCWLFAHVLDFTLELWIWFTILQDSIVRGYSLCIIVECDSLLSNWFSPWLSWQLTKYLKQKYLVTL